MGTFNRFGMIQFILNNQHLTTQAPPGMALLDFIRKDQQLKGSKLVCKEGECGACAVLVGSCANGKLTYQSMTSCIMPLINSNGKHIVTIEGLNMDDLSPVQQAMVDSYATQCGFCTPGFVVSLSGYLLSNNTFTKNGIMESIDGNICRCTGYKSIERAADRILARLHEEVSRPGIASLVRAGWLPSYFKGIFRRLSAIQPAQMPIAKLIKLGGGTDLYVQKPHEMYESQPAAMYDQPTLKQIGIEDGVCQFGASLTMGDLYRSKIFKKALPQSDYIFRLLSSTPIRNMSTIGGNLVNASPIGDFTILLLGLNATILLSNRNKLRELPLRRFYKGYKKMDLRKGEYLEAIRFPVKGKKTYIHFEKVSQRKFLDIASVNFASTIELSKAGEITTIHLAVGGVGPIPMYLEKTTAFLRKRKINEATLREAIEVLYSEISPISDARGSAAYKKLLARQLFLAQFLALDAGCVEVLTI